MSRLDDMLSNSPVQGRPETVRWLIRLFELWSGSAGADVTARRQEVARRVFGITGVRPGPGAGPDDKRNPVWHIRRALNILAGDLTGEDLTVQQQAFLRDARTFFPIRRSSS